MHLSFEILACSGPGAWAAIQEAISYGYLCAAIGGVITLSMYLYSIATQRLGFPLAIAGAMLAIHPAWTVSAVSGDCGQMKVFASEIFTVIFVGLVVIEFILSKLKA